MSKSKQGILYLLIIFTLLFTRLANLNWGLPFPFHPDERNMANAASQLSCNLNDLRNCLNPHFFAYGQFPLYVSYLIVYVMKFFDGDLATSISFEEAVFSLRLISAISSLITVFFVYRILKKIFFDEEEKPNLYVLILLFIFSPGLIQIAHFGTTESLLTLLFTWLVYESLLFINAKISTSHFMFISSLILGLAIATKVSSVVFLAIPIIAVFYSSSSFFDKAQRVFYLLILAFIAGVVFSPYNALSFNEFLGTLKYESEVALGSIKVFYTRQFENTAPVLFQFTKIFPYTLGIPVLILFFFGFITLSKNKNNNFLRFSFLVYFLPNALLYAKWSRFMAPLFPLMILIASLILVKIYNKKLLFYLLLFVSLIPGIAFLSVYTQKDVRLQASEWIYKNIPEENYILSETANVVDLPLSIADSSPNYKYVSFDFYELDSNPSLQDELKEYLRKTDYIFIPSRRIFSNHPRDKYPKLNEYYDKLFNGALGFEKVAQFSSFAKIKLFAKTFLEFPDEQAEETFTVFDHPVVRIYGHTK